MTSPTDSLPDLRGQVTLYATATQVDVEQTLRQILGDTGLEVAEPYPEVLAVACDSEQLRRVCQALSSGEREQILCHLAPDGREPTASQLMRSRSLQLLNSRMDAQWVKQLVDGRRLVTFFQPIVKNCNPRTIYAYECLLRGLADDGSLIPPLRMITAAREAGLLPALDQAAQLVAIESAAKFALPVCFFINFNPRLLDVTSEWIDRTIQAVLESGLDTARFVFEVVESDQILDLPKLLVILDWFREAGCRVALDDVGAGYNSLNLLALVKPDFVKLDMELVRGVHKDRYKSCVARKLLELARELGVLTVVEGVEVHEEWQWARDHGADLAQGYLFARPALLPPTIDSLCASGRVARGGPSAACQEAVTFDSAPTEETAP